MEQFMNQNKFISECLLDTFKHMKIDSKFVERMSEDIIHNPFVQKSNPTDVSLMDVVKVKILKNLHNFENVSDMVHFRMLFRAKILSKN